MRSLFLGSLSAILCFSLSFTDKIFAKPAPEDFGELTILIYAAGDESDIEMATTEGLKLFEKAKGLRNNKKISVFVLHDRTGDDTGKPTVYALDYVEPEKRSKDKVDSKPFNEKEIATALGVEKFTWPEWNTGDPVVKKKFLRMGVRLRPARHYIYLYQGHNWGQDGFAQDFFHDGKKWEQSSIIHNYDFREVLIETYKENADYIPLGKFDAIMMDGCTWLQLDAVLEVGDQVNYIAATALETPYRSFPYDEIMDATIPDLDKLVDSRPNNFDPKVENEKFNKFLEKFFKVVIEKYIRSHGPGGSLIEKEKEIDSVQYAAIRTAGLPRVKAALKNFVEKTPANWLDWREGRLPWLKRLIDIDTNIDLVQFSREAKVKFGELAEDNPDRWKEALAAVEELEKSLGHTAPNHAIEPTHIKHEDAEGAWVTVDIDPVAPRNMAVCMALQALTLLKSDDNLIVPVLKQRGKEKSFKSFKCPDQVDNPNRKKTKKSLALEKRIADKARAGEPFAYPEIWEYKVEWEHGVDAYVTEKQKEEEVREGAPNVASRKISIWVSKGDKKTLDVSAVFRFAGSSSIKVDYLLEGNPKAFIEKQRGRVETVTFKGPDYAPYYLNLDDSAYVIDGKPGLFVGTGQSNHSFIKTGGLGIMMSEDVHGFEPYNEGRIPLPMALSILKKKADSGKVLDNDEKALLKKPDLEQYETFYAAMVEAGGKEEFSRSGIAFYELHSINDTGWPGFLKLKE